MDLNNFKMDNLRKIREKKHITQVRLSIDLEVSQELISQYELGKSKPNIENLFKLADYFHCSTDYLLGRTNNPDTIRHKSETELQYDELLEKYTSLSAENKKHLLNYMDYLVNNNSKK